MRHLCFMLDFDASHSAGEALKGAGDMNRNITYMEGLRLSLSGDYSYFAAEINAVGSLEPSPENAAARVVAAWEATGGDFYAEVFAWELDDDEAADFIAGVKEGSRRKAMKRLESALKGEKVE